MIDFDSSKQIKILTDKIRNNIFKYDGKFPFAASENKIYSYTNNDYWTDGFFVGMIWLSYELTGDEFFKKHAILYSEKMIARIDENRGLDHHDLGFLFSLSLYPAYLHTKEEKYRTYMVKASEKLISRFHVKGDFIQSWGELGVPDEYRAIVDSLMNLPLLFNTSRLTNDDKYKDIALKHFNTILGNHIRDNNTTFHTFFFDVNDGSPKYGETAQGNRAESTWARGQAWGITGLAFNQEYVETNLSDRFDGLLKVFLDNLPSDGVAYWDFDFTDKNPSYKDSSSNAIVLCGLLEKRKQDNTDKYDKIISKFLVDLESYLCLDPETEIILDHSVYALPDNKGVDEGSLWGDYYYLEALARLNVKGFKKYW